MIENDEKAMKKKDKRITESCNEVNQMLILVTGASGFVGEYLCRALHEQKHSIRILSRKNSDLSFLKGVPFEVCQGDITDPASVELASKGVQVVFHLASYIGYHKKERALMEKVNVFGTEVVARACLNNNARLILVSSMAAIGANHSEHETPLTEDASFDYFLKLNLGYYVTKWKAEQSVLKMFKDEGLDVVIVNPTNIYGPGDARKSSRSTQVKVALGKFPFYTYGGVNVVHVESVVQGMLLALEKGRKGERYILGGENLTLYQMFDIIAKEGGNKTPWICLPHALNLFLGVIGVVPYEKICVADMFFWYSSEKAKKELGYNPKSATLALQDSVKWMKKEYANDPKKSKLFGRQANPSLKFVLQALGAAGFLFLLLGYLLRRGRN
jgi:dihydroflavonol-4-reductase